MAIVNVPAPQRADTSILDFMLQMASLRERKESRKLQERQVAIDERALGPRNALNLAQANNMEIITDQKVAEYREFITSENKELRRQETTLRISGIKDEAQAAKAKRQENTLRIEALDKMSPAEQRSLIFADEIAKTSRAEVQGLNASNQALEQQIKLAQLGMQSQAQMFKEKAPLYTLAGSFSDPVQQAAAIAALDASDMQSFSAISAIASETRQSEKAQKTGEAITEKQTGQAIPKLIQREVTPDTVYGDATLATLRTEQAAGRPLPEVRRIRRPSGVDLQKTDFTGNPLTGFGVLSGFGKGEDFMMVTENEARQLGAINEWNAAGSTQQTQPTTPVRDNVRKAVKSTTGTRQPPSKAPDSKFDPSDPNLVKDGGLVVFISPNGQEFGVRPENYDQAIATGYTPKRK